MTLQPISPPVTRRAAWGLIAPALAAILLAACSTPATPTATALPIRPRAATFPTGDDWRTSTPEEQGIDSQLILDMLKKIEAEKLPVRSFVLIRNGTLVTEAYFAPVTREDLQSQRSATKTVTSILAGIAIKEEDITGVDQKVLDFFPEIDPATAPEHAADLTIEHLLTMSDGHAVATSPSYNPSPDKPVDWIDRYFNDRSNRMVYPPGKVFMYNSGSAHVLAAVIEKATGKPLVDSAGEKLFKPLGITDYDWLADPNGITFGNSWLSLRPLDMAKIGTLYLNKGRWNGRQVVPAEWVEASTQKHIDTEDIMPYEAEQDGYGYLWWMNGFDGYSMHGSGGQFVFVVPGSNLVAVFTGAFPDKTFDTNYRLMRDYVLPAVKSGDPLPENTAATQALSDAIARAGSQPPARPVPALPDMAAQVSGKTYRLPDGALLTFAFDYTAEFGLRLEVALGDRHHAFSARGGLDGHFRRNADIDPVISPYPIMYIRGSWQDDHTLIVEQMPPNFMPASLLKFEFGEGRITMEQSYDATTPVWGDEAIGRLVE